MIIYRKISMSERNYHRSVNVLAITRFDAVTASFLKRMWRESICHVSLGVPSQAPKHTPIGPQIQIRRGLAQNFQGLTNSPPKVVQYLASDYAY